MKIINRLTTIIIDVLIAIFLVIAVVFALGLNVYVVLSGSMVPAMPVGGIVLVKKVPFGQIRSGDVISFTLVGGDIVTHRVVESTEDGLVTRGDANEVNDEWHVTEANYLGKMMIALPYLGYVITRFRSLPGLLFSGTILVGVIILNLASTPRRALCKKPEMRLDDPDSL